MNFNNMRFIGLHLFERIIAEVSQPDVQVVCARATLILYSELSLVHIAHRYCPSIEL